MGYQFAHVETYSRKANKQGQSVAFVLAEAARHPGASAHVEAPRPPRTIYGLSPDEVLAKHDAAVEAARVAVGGKQKRLRIDQHTLLTVITSHPYTMAEIAADRGKQAEVRAWMARNMAWLKAEYGEALTGVVAHQDEEHFHLHAYVLPTDPALRVRLLHPGVQAKEAVIAAGGDDANKRGDRAYRVAMREWQDRYYRAVAAPSGLTRLGPGRRRLSGAAWQAEQTQARAAATVIKGLRQRVQHLEAELFTVAEDFARVSDELDGVRSAMHADMRAGM